MVNPWNIPGKKLDIRLQERSSNTSNVVLKKRLSGRFRNLLEDASLHRIKEKIHLILEKGKKKDEESKERKKKNNRYNQMNFLDSFVLYANQRENKIDLIDHSQNTKISRVEELRSMQFPE